MINKNYTFSPLPHTVKSYSINPIAFMDTINIYTDTEIVCFIMKLD